MKDLAFFYLEQFQLILTKCKDNNLEESQVCMSEAYNRNQLHFEFTAGDKVLRKTTNLPLRHWRTRKAKFKHKYIGPLTVEMKGMTTPNIGSRNDFIPHITQAQFLYRKVHFEEGTLFL